MMHNKMGGICKTVNFENQIAISKETFSNKWVMSIPKTAKDAIILDKLEFLKESTSSQLEGELISINNNKFIHADIRKKWEKSGHCTNDAGGMKNHIKEAIRVASFDLRFKIVTKYKNKECEFKSFTIRHLMK